MKNIIALIVSSALFFSSVGAFLITILAWRNGILPALCAIMLLCMFAVTSICTYAVTDYFDYKVARNKKIIKRRCKLWQKQDSSCPKK